MFPAAEAAAFVVEAGVAAPRQGEAAAGLPPFFMGSMWPAAAAGGGGAGAAGSEEEDEAAVAMAEAALHERAVAATRNHREAEKRRRERIKSHLDRLRAVLACDPKIDKASLLAKAVERVRDLKQRMAGIGAESAAATPQLFPTEHDEIVVLASSGGVFEASVCCDDRSDLLPGLIDTLRALRLRTLRAEMATLGGRVRNVLVLARDAGAEDDDGGGDFLKEALRALVERHGAAGGAGDRPKRRRTVSDMNVQAAA